MNSEFEKAKAALLRPWNANHAEGICLRGDEPTFGHLQPGEVTCPYCHEAATCRHIVNEDSEKLVYSLHYARNGGCGIIKPYFRLFTEPPIGPSALLEDSNLTLDGLRLAMMAQGNYQYREYSEFTAVYDQYCRLFLFTKRGHPFHPSATGFLFICDERLWTIDEPQFADMAKDQWVRLNKSDQLFREQAEAA